MTSYVKKNDQRKESFQPEKIKKVIAWATQNLDVNPLVLESKFDEFITDGISTDTIQTNLIHHARILCTPEETDWSIVAGRLETMRRWKKTQVFEKSFYYFIQEQIEQGIYKHPAIKKWTKREIIELGELIIQDNDLKHSYGSVLTATEKYLLPNECIQQMFMVNAMIIASVENKEDRIQYAEDIYEAFSDRKLSSATPWLSNLRSHKNIASCFIMKLDDDLNSIFDNIKNFALISKNGGGAGVDFSRIRAKGSSVGGVKNASKGVTSWIKLFNDTAVSVDQLGKRSGAITVSLPIWHKDIEDFIEMQSESGDIRSKSFDVFPQVGMFDLFMKEKNKDDGGIWHTFCPYEVKKILGINLDTLFGKDFISAYKKCVTAYKHDKLKNVDVYNAKELLKTIMRTQFETGLPYIAFADTINETNPNKHFGTIPCFNLCVESTSVVVPDELAHTCNLMSVVVGRVDSDEEMIRLARLATRILDNGITLTSPPIKESKLHNEKFRTIGVGIQGMHDYVAKNGIKWNDHKEISKVAELIEYGCIEESLNMIHQGRSPYPEFEGSMWNTGELIGRFSKFSNIPELDWDGLGQDVMNIGIRNSQLTSPPPSTSSSLFMDSTAGVMPSYASFYNEDNKTGKFSVYGMYVKEYPLSYSRGQSTFNQSELSGMIGELQKFVDTGISAEYIFDLNNVEKPAVELWNLIDNAWKNKTKAIYYIRSIKKGETIDDIVGGEVQCAGCAG